MNASSFISASPIGALLFLPEPCHALTWLCRRAEDASVSAAAATSVAYRPFTSSALEFDACVHPSRLQICTRDNGSDWKLGEGGFGTVYLAILDHTQAVAMKAMHLDRGEEAAAAALQHFEVELGILRAARHRNVVSFAGAYQEQVGLCTPPEFRACTLHLAGPIGLGQCWSGIVYAFMCIH